MFKTLKLLLPVLIPSWRFFSAIAPSPRVEFVTLAKEDARPVDWQEFRPRPATLSITAMLKRLVWNPIGNETLFVVSCAERLLENPTEHSREEIFARIAGDLQRQEPAAAGARFLQFRLVFIYRDGAEVKRSVEYLSPVREWVRATTE